MKKTDLEKNKALKLMENLRKGGTPNRFGAASSAGLPDRREQRRLDKAEGLVSFPLKLNEDLIAAIRQRAQDEDTGINEVVGNLLRQALAAGK